MESSGHGPRYPISTGECRGLLKHPAKRQCRVREINKSGDILIRPVVSQLGQDLLTAMFHNLECITVKKKTLVQFYPEIGSGEGGYGIPGGLIVGTRGRLQMICHCEK